MNRITDRLWIADIQSVRERPTERFDRIVSVCQDSVEDNVGCEYDFFNMSDGPGNIYGGDSSYQLFQEAAEAVVVGLEQGETVECACGWWGWVEPDTYTSPSRIERQCPGCGIHITVEASATATLEYHD